MFILCQLSSSAVSSLTNISHKCTSVLNKKADTVATADSPDSPVDSLKEKVVFSSKKKKKNLT